MFTQIYNAVRYPSALSTYQAMDWWIENVCHLSPPCRFARPRPVFWNFIYGRRALDTPALLFALGPTGTVEDYNDKQFGTDPGSRCDTK